MGKLFGTAKFSVDEDCKGCIARALDDIIQEIAGVIYTLNVSQIGETRECLIMDKTPTDTAIYRLEQLYSHLTEH